MKVLIESCFHKYTLTSPSQQGSVGTMDVFIDVSLLKHKTKCVQKISKA